MDPNTRALMMGAAGAGGAAETLYVEDVFSTWLYTGNGGTQTITNGIDLAGEGGLVWFKDRNLGYDHRLFDTLRGVTKQLRSNSTIGEFTQSNILNSFNSTGFTLGSDTTLNGSGDIYASWTFRKAPKFFDVVTYTGTGSVRTVPHNLGSVPGCIIIKSSSLGGTEWVVYHRSLGASSYVQLHSTAAATSTSLFNNTAPTSTVFSLSIGGDVNSNGNNYVAYLFAHETDADSLIQCGSYTGNGSTSGPVIDLGWEPQWLLIKRTDAAEEWWMFDSMRGLVVGGNDARLYANQSAAESAFTAINPLPTGFQPNTTNSGINASGGTYTYIAIRRGPMKTPTDATKVFQPKVYTGTNVDNRLVTTDIVTDMAWVRQRNDTVLGGMVVGDRLRGQPYLLTGSSSSEVNDADSFDQQLVSTEFGNAWSSMTGFWVGNDATSKLNVNTTSNNHVVEAFRRAPGFLDVVAYTGTGAARTVSHNLGVSPELMIVKSRSTNNDWSIYASPLGNTNFLEFSTPGASVSSSYWNNTSPTDSVFTLGNEAKVNGNGATFIAYLFASCSGVSKVGSYTGTGTTLQVDCGFTAGARFVLIKRTDTTGDWYIWDTARGIVTGNDPFRLLNATGADNESTDYIDPLNSGFEISSSAPAAINASGGSFIYLAVA